MVKNANPLFRAAAVAVAALALFPVACGRDNAAATQTAAVAPTKTVADFFPIKVGDKMVRMQLAVRSAEMQRGLMDRRDLGSDDGMIFVYEKPQQMSFWMRNTPTALDIGFFNAKGVLEEVYPMYPFDETSVSSHGTEMTLALEMNQGWYRKNNVKPGAQIDLKALAGALRARGFEPKKFGLPDSK